MLGKYSKSSSEEESESEAEEVLPKVKNGTPKANGRFKKILLIKAFSFNYFVLENWFC